MTKLCTLAAGLLVLGALASPLPAASATAALPDNATAQKMVEDFAPWVSAVIQQKFAVADRIYPIEKYAQTELENSGAADVFARVARVDDTPLSLVGVRILGDHIGACGSLLFPPSMGRSPLRCRITATGRISTSAKSTSPIAGPTSRHLRTPSMLFPRR